MNIGIPKEIKPHEGRIALLPKACEGLVAAGNTLFLQAGAGVLSGYSDADYAHVGVNVVPSAEELYASAQLIVKVKEPTVEELPLLRPEHCLFCYLHLAALPQLTEQLCEIGLTAIGFETVQTNAGHLPLLAPMSAIAGRVATQVGTNLLHLPQQGKGLLLGGVAGADPGKVVVIGAGVAGTQAALLADAMGADVVVLDKIDTRLKNIERQGQHIKGVISDSDQVTAAVAEADLLIGAVLVPGAKAPKVVTAAMLQAMPAGGVVVDISVDQGGCIETTRPTTYDAPTYVSYDLTHFTVTNMPGAVPHTASQALSRVVSPYVHELCSVNGSIENDELRHGLNIENGQIVLAALESA